VAEVPAGQSYVVLVGSWPGRRRTHVAGGRGAITMSVSDPGIKAGDTIYEVTTAGLEAVGTATVDGTATITFSSDPTFLIAATVLCAQSALTITTSHGHAGAAPCALLDERWFGNWRDHVYRREWHGERLCDLGSSLTARARARAS